MLNSFLAARVYMFVARKRGRYDHVMLNESPVIARLVGCVVTKVTESGGKRYATLDASLATGDKQLLLDVDEFIRTRARPRFSPLRFAWAQVTVKLVARDDDVAPGDVVDVELTPGAFGTFGWCLLARAISQTSP